MRLAAPVALHQLGFLVFSEHALELDHQLVLGSIAARAPDELHPHPGPGELLDQQRLAGDRAGQAVRGVDEHHIDAALGREVAQRVQGRADQRRPGVALVLEHPLLGQVSPELPGVLAQRRRLRPDRLVFLLPGLGHRNPVLQQPDRSVEPLGMLHATRTTASHDINVLPDMSTTATGTPWPFQPPVTQGDVEAEVIHCVGGVVSPILSNIYLHKLDEFVERELIPQYTRGKHRAPNPEYQEVKNRLRNARRHGDRAAARDLRRQLRAFPAGDPMDPGYRRLFYCRYADDHLLGFTGPKAEAEQIKAELARFLRETLALELNPDKTLISRARTQPARFLGYDIIVQHCNTKITRGLRSANGKIALRVPPDVVKAQCARYRSQGKPWHRPWLQNLPDHDIVRIYGAEYRGVVNYYLLAQDVSRLGTLCWTALTSMLKTLAAKHKSTVTKMAARFTAKVITADGPRTCFEARIRREGKKDLVARFGGIPLRQDRRAVITDPAPVPVTIPRKELIYRLRKRRCELCEHGATVAVHQVTALTSLGRPGPGQPAWAALMAKMRRKTLIVCGACHDWIHANPVAHAA